jgi:hypothetical protein
MKLFVCLPATNERLKLQGFIQKRIFSQLFGLSLAKWKRKKYQLNSGLEKPSRQIKY